MFCSIFIVASTFLFSQFSHNLYSPYIELPAIGEDETIHFGFWIYSDMPDYDGDNDDYLDDYYNIAISDISALAWHPSDFNSIDGNNFWCSDNDIEGYLDSWIHYLDTPSIAVGSGGEYFSRIYYAIESPDGAEGEVENSCTDGWDTANIRISIDGGVSWELLNGSIPYDFNCGYGWIWNDAEYETGGSLNHLAAGWGGSSNGWVDFSADLSDYAGENIMIRIAFGSDPAWSTVDENSLTGFQIDDIMIEDDTGVLFSDLGNDMSQMVASGEVWIDQFYDYGSIESGRPGASGWEFYSPGMPFNGNNIFMNITEFEEKIIQFRFQSRYDNNHDGGMGGGLFIDDFMVYKLSLGTYFAPRNLTAEAGNNQVILTWEDMNTSGTENFIYESGIFSEDNSIYTTEGNGWAGQLFDIIGPSRINSFSIYNIAQIDTTISVAVYGMFGTTIDTEPTYTMEVPLNSSLDWNNFIVSDSSWIMENYFIIAHEISYNFGVAVDTTQTSGHSYLRIGGSWLGLANSLGYQGELGIRSNITYEGANVSYNIYRNDSLIVSELLDDNYTDSGLTNNTTYEYTLTAIYSDGEESGESNTVSVTPFANTVHEESYDDGSFEAEFNAGSGNFSAGSSGEDIVRFKWYQNGSGGAFYIKVFEDDAGMPGSEIYSAVQASGNIDGWNEKDLSSQGLNISGDFWVGTKEFSSSKPFGLDTDSNSGNSYKWISSGTEGSWETVVGNLMYRVYLDSLGGTGRVLSNLNEIEKPLGTSHPIYSLQWENKKLRRVPSFLNGNKISSLSLSLQSDILNRVNIITDTLFILEEYYFEEVDNEWTHSDGWNLTTIESFSPDHSYNSPNDSLNGLFSVEYTIPKQYIINRIFPNPFNPIVNIQFTISELANIKLSIYDLNGRIVNTLINKIMSPGYHTISWNGKDSHGKPVSSGVYFSILENKDKSFQSQKLVLLK